MAANPGFQQIEWFLEAELGVVLEPIAPFSEGIVSFKGTHWQAVCLQAITIRKESVVSILGLQNLTLIVHPVGGEREAEEKEKAKLSAFLCDVATQLVESDDRIKTHQDSVNQLKEETHQDLLDLAKVVEAYELG